MIRPDPKPITKAFEEGKAVGYLTAKLEDAAAVCALAEYLAETQADIPDWLTEFAGLAGVWEDLSPGTSDHTKIILLETARAIVRQDASERL